MDLSWLSALIVGAGCFALGYCIGTRPFFLISARKARDAAVANEMKKNKTKEPFEIEKLADILEDFKMVSHIPRTFSIH